MNDITITITKAGAGYTADPKQAAAGMQFDENNTQITFIRPLELEAANLVLRVNSTNNINAVTGGVNTTGANIQGMTRYEPVHLGLENVFLLPKSLTQELRLKIQPVFLVDDTQINTPPVILTLEPSLSLGHVPVLKDRQGGGQIDELKAKLEELQAEIERIGTEIEAFTDNHNELNGLEYESSGHTGFASENALSGKLDKVTTAGSERVYAVSTDGQTQKTLNVIGNTVDDYTLPIRNERGTFTVGEPQNPSEPATKNYVDIGNSVSEVRSGEVRNGIQVHCVSVGAIYSYFTGENFINETITLEMGETFLMATPDDFPELELYQGTPLIEQGLTMAFVPAEGGGFELSLSPVTVLVGNEGIAITNLSQYETLIIAPPTAFTFNKLLILGQPSGISTTSGGQ